MRAAYKRTNFGSLGKRATSKLQSDNDIKIIIQGQNSQTGIGKTTLAIQLCRFIDQHEWGAEDKAFIDVRKYINAHLDKPQGSALLLDEIEHGADSRRASSHENVQLSQAWAKMRARNIATVATLPSVSMLDKRMLEMADYWILVRKRGIAQPYEINVNDFKPWKTPQRKPLPGDEHIQFVDLPDDDPDKSYLDELKDDMLRSEDMELLPKSKHKEIVEQEREKAREEGAREKRNEMIREMYEKTDYSTTQLADEFECVEVKQPQVSTIINSE